MLVCAEYVIPVTSDPFRGGAVLVRDGVIRDIGKADQLKLRYPDEEVMDFGLSAIMPGLIDMQTHLEGSVMRGIVNDVPFTTWLQTLTELTGRLDLNDLYESAIMGGLDALSSGITTVGDITSSGAPVTATQKLGLRSVIFREVGAIDRDRVDFAVRSAEKDIFHWREEVDSSRVTIGISPEAVYANHPSVYAKVTQFATKENIPVAMRLSSSREEHDFVMYGSSPFSVHSAEMKRGYVETPPWLPTGVTPIRYALNWGAFEAPNVIVINPVLVTDEDVRKMREHDIAVCVCPRANAQLGRGVAPMTEFLQAGLRMGFGTDSPAATASTDMMAEMRIGMMFQRAVNTRRFLDSATVLEMATIGGARALGLDDKVGSLEIGKCADIIAVDLSSSHQAPTGNPVSAIVNTCSQADVLMTMVDGKVLYRQGKWELEADVARNIAHIIEIRGKLRA